MGMPALLTINGTGSTIWMTDWMQQPFQIGIGVTTGTTGVNGTAIVECTFSDPNPVDVNGVSSASVVWFPVIALTGANATANFTTPVQALRASVVTATATSAWTFNFIQPTFGR
jgi:hypothetical protein